ncbi:MAG: c-type cytochrome, partial [Verrucomicrobiota bacterium]
QDHQNPNLQPSPYDPESEYEKGVTVTFPDEQLGENAVREYRSTKKIQKGEAPNLSDGSWKQAHSNDYELGKQLFSSLQCVQCHAVNRTGIGAKGPNLTLYGLRTSLAAGWMRNDEENLAKWLRNSQEVKFGNLMWNGEGVGDNHPLRQLENDDQKVNQLIEYLLGQI